MPVVFSAAVGVLADVDMPVCDGRDVVEVAEGNNGGGRDDECEGRFWLAMYELDATPVCAENWPLYG